MKCITLWHHREVFSTVTKGPRPLPLIVAIWGVLNCPLSGLSVPSAHTIQPPENSPLEEKWLFLENLSVVLAADSWIVVCIGKIYCALQLSWTLKAFSSIFLQRKVCCIIGILCEKNVLNLYFLKNGQKNKIPQNISQPNSAFYWFYKEWLDKTEQADGVGPSAGPCPGFQIVYLNSRPSKKLFTDATWMHKHYAEWELVLQSRISV